MKSPLSKQIEFSQNTVLVKVNITKFTEGMLELPILVENLPYGLNLKTFSVFVGAPGTKLASPHIDGGGFEQPPMVARLNVPLRGIKGSKVSWWNTGVEDPRILERHFEEWNAKKKEWQPGFSYLADPNAVWEEPDYTVNEPGPCWNRTELTHKLDLIDTTEIRINITAELLIPVTWETLVKRLHSKGHCK